MALSNDLRLAPDGLAAAGERMVALPERELKELRERAARLQANLGCATTGELLAELHARCDLNGTLNYRTVDVI